MLTKTHVLLAGSLILLSPATGSVGGKVAAQLPYVGVPAPQEPPASNGTPGEFHIVPLKANMHFGESRTLVTSGSVKVVAECTQVYVQPGVQVLARIRLLAETTVNGAFMDGDTDHNDGSLNTDTLAEERVLLQNQSAAGLPDVRNDIDDGFVQSGDGHYYIGVQGETTALGVNTHAGDCSVRGVAFVISE